MCNLGAERLHLALVCSVTIAETTDLKTQAQKWHVYGCGTLSVARIGIGAAVPAKILMRNRPSSNPPQPHSRASLGSSPRSKPLSRVPATQGADKGKASPSGGLGSAVCERGVRAVGGSCLVAVVVVTGVMVESMAMLIVHSLPHALCGVVLLYSIFGSNYSANMYASSCADGLFIIV